MTEVPQALLDRRPRKRPRLGWDVLPEVQIQNQVANKVLDLDLNVSELRLFLVLFVCVVDRSFEGCKLFCSSGMGKICSLGYVIGSSIFDLACFFLSLYLFFGICYFYGMN